MPMTIDRRRVLRLAAGAAAFPAISRLARAQGVQGAQAYPTRPIRLIVGFAAGSAIDISARLAAQWLSEHLGQTVVVENRPGASANLATEAVVRAPADGYTLLAIGTFSAINATLYRNLSFDFIRDIAPVCGIAQTAGVMVVSPSLPVATVAEFIAYAKARPGKVNLASTGPGSAPGLYGELFKSMAGVDLTTVNYRGSAPALSDLMAGEVHVMFDVVSSAMGLIKGGKIKPLGVTTARRSPVLPDVPTVGEALPGYEASGWQGIGAPKNTPTAIIEALNTSINAALVDPAFTARLAELGISPFPGSPADIGKFIVDYTEKWARVIRAANIKLE
jgi:tripartite-type tricarboxylate transporter receptor subunit TctC